MTNELCSNPNPKGTGECPKQITINKVANGYAVRPHEAAHVNELLVFKDAIDLWAWINEWDLT